MKKIFILFLFTANLIHSQTLPARAKFKDAQVAALVSDTSNLGPAVIFTSTKTDSIILTLKNINPARVRIQCGDYMDDTFLPANGGLDNQRVLKFTIKNGQRIFAYSNVPGEVRYTIVEK